MRIGIDARTLERADDLRGIGVLVQQIVERLLADGIDTVLFYSRPPEAPPAHRCASVVVMRSTPSALRRRFAEDRTGSATVVGKLRPALGLFWEQVLLPLALRRHRVDVFHAPANRGIPLVGGPRFVGSINDVIPLVTPYFFDGQPDPPLTTWFFRLIHWATSAVVTWRAARIITLSDHSRRDIIRLFPWARKKTAVIYPGVDPRYRRVTDEAVLERVRARHGIPPRYLLYVGGLGQRKNLSGLLHAYAIVARHMAEVPPLVIVGKMNYFSDPLSALATRLGIVEQVRFPGFVPTEDMPAVISGAELLVYPSFYEGFGLPVIEAMACGCPVICSQTSSLPEVAADAALYCDPADPGDIAARIEQMLLDSGLRRQLIEKGFTRARAFSAEKMLAETIRIYREVMENRPRPGGSEQSSLFREHLRQDSQDRSLRSR